MDIYAEIREMAQRAKSAAAALNRAAPKAKNLFLETLAKLLTDNEAVILAANSMDVEAARAKGVDEARLDRLALTPAIIRRAADSCLEVAAMPDPIGALETQWRRPNGLLVGKMRVPLGVIAMIYEARPNVTIEAAILCVKAGDAIILRGGSDAARSNEAFAKLLREALIVSGLPEYSCQLVATRDREAVYALCKQDEWIDAIIPRGGESLIRAVCDAATMPVLKHYKGVCHAYVDAEVDIEEACRIIVNSKAQRPGVCNALECLLVNAEIAPIFLPELAKKFAPYKVRFRADAASLPLLGEGAEPLADEDKGREFHALVLAVIVVNGLDEAMNYIERYGSRHTDIICTKNYNHATRFLREVDASLVAVNASTRFNDGGELGLGAEIGISTSKLHAYGPMGVKELTTTKFVALGDGQTRA